MGRAIFPAKAVQDPVHLNAAAATQECRTGLDSVSVRAGSSCLRQGVVQCVPLTAQTAKLQLPHAFLAIFQWQVCWGLVANVCLRPFSTLRLLYVSLVILRVSPAQQAPSIAAFPVGPMPLSQLPALATATLLTT